MTKKQTLFAADTVGNSCLWSITVDPELKALVLDVGDEKLIGSPQYFIDMAEEILDAAAMVK